MTRTDLLQMLPEGENSEVEFKRDAIENQELAKELVAFLNFEGGVVLLGVEDDGTLSGVTRQNVEEWVADACRTKVDPPVVPHLTMIRNAGPGKDVLAVRVPQGPDKPYARVHNQRRTYYIRVGRTSREASKDELERMFQASGRVHYGAKPVPGASLADLDLRRLRDYFVHVLGGNAPEDDEEAWRVLLGNLELMTSSSGDAIPTIDGMLLFGRTPTRFLPQSGIRAISFPGNSADYAAREDTNLRGPLLPLLSADGSVVESGLVEQALDFVRRNTVPEASIVDGRRVDHPAYPETVLREAIVNALVHRDYSIIGTDIMLSIYSDRLEVQSPGRLPNTVSLDGIKIGMRYARNQNLVNVMRDYRYVDFRGMGVREKIIPGMRAHNGTEPEFLVEENRFTVRLLRERKP